MGASNAVAPRRDAARWRARRVLWGGLGGCARAALLVATLLWSSGPIRAEDPPLKISGMTMVSTRGDVTELLVEADEALVEEDSELAHLKGVHARLAGADGSTSLELTCDTGDLDLVSSDFLASGDVRGLLGDGRRFTGPWLRYDHAKGLAYTDAPVKITEANSTLTGGGFRYHVREGRLRLMQGASVVEAE
jgi:LPS export ABC transporter protein LptC